MTSRPAISVLFLGVDGAGKTTQAGLLAGLLQRQHRTLTRYIAPPVSDVDQRIVRALEAAADTTDGKRSYWLARTLLGVRRMHESLSAPLSDPGHVVVMDRYRDCHYAVHHAVSSGTDENVLRTLLDLLPEPTVTFWLEVPIELAVRRLVTRGSGLEEPGYLHALREGYLSSPGAGRYVRLDGTAPVKSVHAAVIAHLSSLDLVHVGGDADVDLHGQ